MQCLETVRRATVVHLLYLTLRHFLLSNKFSSEDQNHAESHIFTIGKPSYLFVVLTLNIILVVLLMGIFNSQSQLLSCSFSTISELSRDPTGVDYSYLYLHHSTHTTIQDEGDYIAKHEDHDEKDNDFIPRLVYVDYIKGGESSDHEKGDLSCVYQGYEGFLEDNDDDDSSEDDHYDHYDDLNKRIEDFIEKNNKTWMTDLLRERHLLHTASAQQFHL